MSITAKELILLLGDVDPEAEVCTSGFAEKVGLCLGYVRSVRGLNVNGTEMVFLATHSKEAEEAKKESEKMISEPWRILDNQS